MSDTSYTFSGHHENSDWKIVFKEKPSPRDLSAVLDLITGQFETCARGVDQTAAHLYFHDR